jgi:hypothetical protein
VSDILTVFITIVIIALMMEAVSVSVSSVNLYETTLRSATEHRDVVARHLDDVNCCFET